LPYVGRMQLPKAIAAGVCIVVLGAQLFVSFPISREQHGWYWPFLPYPMYSVPHARADTLVLPELRVAECGSSDFATIATPETLGIPRNQYHRLLGITYRDSSAAARSRAAARLTAVIDAQFPGRYCSASSWVRVVRIADTSTHHLRVPMRRTAVWQMNRTGDE
jgi:hypothetical protein